MKFDLKKIVAIYAFIFALAASYHSGKKVGHIIGKKIKKIECQTTTSKSEKIKEINLLK